MSSRVLYDEKTGRDAPEVRFGSSDVMSILMTLNVEFFKVSLARFNADNYLRER